MINKKTLSERDICSKCITPAIQKSGWDLDTQILEEISFKDGKIFVRGKLTARGKRKRADYILYCNSNPVAIIDARTIPTPLMQAFNKYCITLSSKSFTILAENQSIYLT